MRPTKYVRQRRAPLNRRLVWGLLAAFLVAALATAYMTFVIVRSVISTYFPPAKSNAAAPPVAVATSVPINPKLLTNPLQSNDGPAPKDWDGKSRISILVMGLDYRDWEDNPGGPSRTDTMILFTVDPATRSAGMLSIPS